MRMSPFIPEEKENIVDGLGGCGVMLVLRVNVWVR
jgi:hypothetical protein